MLVTKKTWVTARQLAEMPDDGYLYELLWRGIRKMVPSSEEHGLVSAEMAEKVADYLAAGGRMVVVIDPPRRTQPSTVHRPGREPQVLTEADTLDGGGVAPGWQMPVRGILA